MTFKKISLAILCLLLLYACKGNVSEADHYINRARSYIEEDPEKALSALDSISYPDELDKERFYDYMLLQIQAKDKTYRNIKGDTLIFEIKNHYKKKNNTDKLAMASYCCGRVLEERRMSKEAMAEYLEAESIIENQDGNNNLKGLIQSSIGYLFFDEMLEKEARDRFLRARRFYTEAGNRKNEIISTSQIGNTYMLGRNDDSAHFHYQKALQMADQLKDNDVQTMIRQNIGVTYRNQKEYEQAKEYFRDALKYADKNLNKARIYVNFSKIYQRENRIDSALYSLNMALELMKNNPHSYLYSSIYKSFTDIYQNSGDYKKALEYNKQYANTLRHSFDQNESEAITNIQKKYNYEIVRNINNRLKIEQLTISLVATIIIAGLLGTIVYYLRKSKKKKIKLLESEQKVVHLTNMAKGFDEKENTFRAHLLRHFDILRKAALMEEYLRLRDDEKKIGEKLVKKFNEIVYNKETLDWEILYATMNELHNGLFDELHDTFPELDESEFRICCLLYSEFSNSEISIIMNYSNSTVSAKRSSIRKKTGIKYYGNIVEYIDKEVEKTRKKKQANREST